MPNNGANIEIGIFEVWAGSTLLGHTKGGAEVTFGTEWLDLTVDQFGSAPMDKALTGTSLSVKIMLAETTLANLAKAVPGARYDANAAVDSKIGFGRQAGFLASAVAIPWRFHPVNRAPTDFNKDLYIWKGISSEPLTVNYKIDEQKIYEITVTALVDESRIDGYVLGRIGDDTIS